MALQTRERLLKTAGLGIVYFLLLNLLSAVSITVDIWLGIKGQLGGNAAATIISCLIVTRLSSGLVSLSNKTVMLALALLAGLSSVMFLALLHVVPDTVEPYQFPALTPIEALSVMVFNALIFVATVWFVSKSERRRPSVE
ncbi:hypothetical protein DES49_2687 [Halospina denitrificans]|uniref:Uncharacterized protein n=1 Tax=Halospina denitrificans TaxID=332522 RepID=A0A4V3EPL4_9GAMM|nr:hypothetical protein [Halospina denitrificans]TDT37728.1 hypothetical protein DES49_2687 [Halospina denitrificans]